MKSQSLSSQSLSLSVSGSKQQIDSDSDSDTDPENNFMGYMRSPCSRIRRGLLLGADVVYKLLKVQVAGFMPEKCTGGIAMPLKKTGFSAGAAEWR